MVSEVRISFHVCFLKEAELLFPSQSLDWTWARTPIFSQNLVVTSSFSFFFLNQAERYKADDEANKEKVEAKNQLENYSEFQLTHFPFPFFATFSDLLIIQHFKTLKLEFLFL